MDSYTETETNPQFLYEGFMPMCAHQVVWKIFETFLVASEIHPMKKPMQAEAFSTEEQRRSQGVM